MLVSRNIAVCNYRPKRPPRKKRKQPALACRIVTPSITRKQARFRAWERNNRGNSQLRSGGGSADCMCCAIASSQSAMGCGISCWPVSQGRTRRSAIFNLCASSRAGQPISWSTPTTSAVSSGAARKREAPGSTPLQRRLGLLPEPNTGTTRIHAKCGREGKHDRYSSAPS